MSTEIRKYDLCGDNGCERVIYPLVDIFETQDGFVIKADMPGVQKQNIDISLHDNILEINGKVNGETDDTEKKYSEYSLSKYHREFNVGNDIDGNRIEASLGNGILNITLPKKEEVKPKKIEITVN